MSGIVTGVEFSSLLYGLAKCILKNKKINEKLEKNKNSEQLCCHLRRCTTERSTEG